MIKIEEYIRDEISKVLTNVFGLPFDYVLYFTENIRVNRFSETKIPESFFGNKIETKEKRLTWHKAESEDGRIFEAYFAVDHELRCIYLKVTTLKNGAGDMVYTIQQR